MKTPWDLIEEAHAEHGAGVDAFLLGWFTQKAGPAQVGGGDCGVPVRPGAASVVARRPAATHHQH